MTSKEYFEKEYGSEHIENIVKMNDLESLHGLIDEFKNSELDGVINKGKELETVFRIFIRTLSLSNAFDLFVEKYIETNNSYKSISEISKISFFDSDTNSETNEFE